MTERTWSCMCGNFEGKVAGDASLAVWCHCLTCRKQTGAAMQLGVFPKIDFIKGGGDLIGFEANAGSGVTRYSCNKCGSFCYKKIGPEVWVVPLGALSGDVIKPTCHIYVKDKGHQDIMFPELPQHQELP